jgi:hypothetical protein
VTEPEPSPAPHQPEESGITPAPSSGVAPGSTSGVTPGDAPEPPAAVPAGTKRGGCLGGAAALLALAVAAAGYAVHLAAGWIG